MKILKILISTILSFSIIILILFYCLLRFVIPNTLNSHENITKIENFICEKTGLKVVTDNFKIFSTPLLKYRLNIGKIIIYTGDNIKTAEITNFISNIDLKNLYLKNIYAEEIKINGDEFQNYFTKFSKTKNKKNLSLNLNKLPSIAINRIQYKSGKGIIFVKDFDFINNIVSFYGEIKTPILKNNLTIGNQGHIKLIKDALFADDFHITYGKNTVDIEGKLFDKSKNYDFRIKGSNLPVDEIQKSLLFYQKTQDPTKKFIENFKNYSGTIDIDLNIKNTGIYGQCKAKNLSANAIWFNIPIYFKEAVFNFHGKTLTSIAQGLLGGERVIHTLNITKLGSADKEVLGQVHSTLTPNFKYIPDLAILNSVDAGLKYNIKNKIINVEYLVDLDENSDLLYKTAYLGLRDRHRKFNVKTVKDRNNLYIKQYQYSTIENGNKNVLITGDGLFEKEQGHFNPKYITCKTNGYAPTSVTGSFKQYFDGGEFNGDLKYDFITNKIFGDFEIVNTRFKDFYIDSAKISANENVLIKSYGLYLGEIFTGDAIIKNDFKENNIVFKDLDLFLDRFFIKSTPKKPDTKIDITSKVKNSDITIENWNINVNEIRKGKIILNNIKLLGSLKDNIFKFLMPELNYANGTLSANGKYDFNNNTSTTDFNAKNIDSNIVADMIFDLPNQVEGIADATLHTETSHKFDDIKANAYFRVNNGFLPELGSTKFMKSKVKISDIVNIDFSKKNALQSDIEGTLDINNSHVKNINLTSQQKFLSMYIEGNYEIYENIADLNLYGKYDKLAPKGVKIVFVPLNWILKAVFKQEKTINFYKTKLDKIPSIDTKVENEKFFRVNVKGNLKQKDKLKIELKGIK